MLKHARRAVAEFEAVKFSGKQNGAAVVGEVRLGVGMPPIGERMHELLAGWRQSCANVVLRVSEMGERDLAIALDERQLDVVLAPSHMLPSRMARLVAHRERGVVAFDTAGPEDGFPSSRYREAFDYLAGEFMPVTVHAGEAAGPASIRSALIDGRALRLGHGVRIAEDLQVIEREGDEVQVQFGDLARWVRDREIPLELSPSSNLQTGAIAQWGDEFADHPFDLLYQLGFAVTVNTDNRTMSDTSLTRELARLVEAFDYDLDDLETFQFNAASAVFLLVEEREELVEMISEGFQR